MVSTHAGAVAWPEVAEKGPAEHMECMTDRTRQPWAQATFCGNRFLGTIKMNRLPHAFVLLICTEASLMQCWLFLCGADAAPGALHVARATLG